MKALVYCVATLFCGFLLSSPQAKAQTTNTVSLPALKAALSDGPIQVQPALLPKKSVSAQAAVQAAQQSTGVSFSKVQAWPVAFTDRENLSRLGTNLPCWLLASSQHFTLPLADELAAKGTLRRETLYAVINAQTGIIIEAFSKPRVAWWRRVLVTNENYLRSVNYQDQSAFPAATPPRLPLTRPFRPSASSPSSALINRFGGGRADQFIARYFVYTDLSFTVPTHLASSPQNKFVFLRQPVWDIRLEGLNTPVGGPVQVFTPPMPPHENGTVPFPRQEELSTVINATSGESFDTSRSRDGRQIDML